MLRDATQRSLLELLDATGVPYEINKSQNFLVIQECNSKILFRSMEEYERLRGTNLAWFGLDELTYVAEEAWLRLEARLPKEGSIVLDITREHPEYVLRRSSFQAYRDLYAGGEQFMRNSYQYLTPRHQEPARVYAERASHSYYENYIGSIIDWYAATLFRREPVITLEGDSQAGKRFFGQLNDDCDRKGTALTDFFRHCFTETLVQGASHILVDFPRLQDTPLTRADEEARGVSRAFLVSYTSEELINWSRELQRLGVVKLDLAYRAVKDDILRTDDGRLGNSTLSMTANAYTGAVARITRGKGAGQERLIQANSPTAVAVTPAWTVIPDATSHFVVAEAGWKLGASSPTSPVEFPIPNRGGATLQISGRSANANGQESAPELSPLTRWQIGGGSGPGGALDADLPPAPSFGLGGAAEGSLELSGVAFPSLVNTRTISGGTLTLYAWNELLSPTAQLLSVAVSDSATVIALSAARAGTSALPGDLVQIEAEILRIVEVSTDGLSYTVERASHETEAVAYAAGTPLYYLERNVFVVPFVRDFFGSPASGQYTHPLYWPDVRVAAAEITVTNVYGESPKTMRNLTLPVELGLRTLSGGQLTLQFDGPLAIGSSVTPILLVERRQAVREIYAVVADPPSGASIVARVMRNGVAYAELTIISGMTQSNSVSGFGLTPLEAGERITVDIIQVPSSAAGTPGRDLTVILSR